MLSEFAIERNIAEAVVFLVGSPHHKPAGNGSGLWGCPFDCEAVLAARLKSAPIQQQSLSG